MGQSTAQFLALTSLFFWACQPNQKSIELEDVPETLPLTDVSLQNLSVFDLPGANWQLASAVNSDYEVEQSMESEPGTGILLCLPTEKEHSNLFMGFEHGDMELEIEFMMPKGSNSGLYFQGRYEIQLFDSWNVANPAHSDCGGIYQRWDGSLSEEQKGFDGVSPKVNASKAPGLWQTVKASFRAPRFDLQGNKIENARFNYVYLNNVLIHENVDLGGPTRASADNEESALAKFMIQGDHGPVAFRNIRYKAYDHTKKLELENLTYKYYEDTWDTLPDFSNLIPIDSGSSELLNVRELARRNENYGYLFTGRLSVPVSGKYLFDVFFDNGGELFIDGKRILGDIGENGGGSDKNLVDLSKGKHDFEVSHFQTVWGSTINIQYEGPGIFKQTLALPLEDAPGPPPTPLIVEAKSVAEMTRGYIQYKDTVKTHALSVGDPRGIHYTYDLATGSLILGWKGIFADVTNMWHSRGITQLLIPGNTAIEFDEGPVLGSMKGDSWKGKDNYLFKKYVVNEKEQPTFYSVYGKVTITDSIVPSDSEFPGLNRTIAIENANTSDAILIASGHVLKMRNGSYNINGKYYLLPSSNMANEMQIIHDVGIIVPINSSKVNIQYSVIW